MKKRNQIRRLIVFCLAVLAGLISIQYYLIRNSYNLLKKEYISEIKKQLYPIIDAPETDMLQDKLNEEIIRLAELKSKKKITLSEFRSRLSAKSDSIRKEGNSFLRLQEIDYPILKEVKLRFQYNEIIYGNEFDSDTITHLNDSPLIYIGEQIYSSEVFNINSGNLNTRNLSEENEVRSGFTFSVKHAIDVDVSNWQQKVLSQLFWMLFFAVVLFLSVILLFYSMFRSFLKQKKIADIKTDFANNISHELKTPLSSIAIILKSLKKDSVIRNEEKRTGLILSLERQNHKIQHIADQVMETSFQSAPTLQYVDAASFLHQVAIDFKTETHTLHTEIAADSVTLLTDPVRLERIIHNILENAEKYSPEGSLIVLKSNIAQKNYFISVSDQGAGISEEERKRVFDKFHRISEGYSHNKKGLGLGLYLSRQMIEQLGGEILISGAKDQGTTFTLKLPLP